MDMMDTDSSIASEDPSFLTSTSTSSKRKKGISAMSLWKHTRPPKEGQPDRKSRLKLMYCAYCVATRVYVTEVSTNFRRHLTRQHDIEVECENTVADDSVHAFERLYGQAAKIGREGELQEACVSHAIDQGAVNEALVSLIVIRNLSYRAVEWRELHHLVMALTSLVLGTSL
jgi:hypothetical protein